MNENAAVQIKKRQDQQHCTTDMFPNAVSIVPYLYIGSADAAKDVEFMREKHIAAVVALGTGKVSTLDLPHLCIDALDMEDVNLLKFFQQCLDFIHGYIDSEKAVLVHCVYGQSRSASICVMYLMSTLCLSLTSAYNLVLHARPCIFINYGFLKQLLLFEQMNCKFDGHSSAHAKYRLINAATEKFESGKISRTLPDGTSVFSGPNYSCQKCNIYLFSGSNEVDHLDESPHGYESNKYGRKKHGKVHCSQLFVEILPWLYSTEKLQSLNMMQEGKIICPRALCKNKIGSWNWDGTWCSCGIFVKPAFQINPSKVSCKKN